MTCDMCKGCEIEGGCVHHWHAEAARFQLAAQELVEWLHSDYWCTCSPMQALEEFVAGVDGLELPSRPRS